MRSSESGLKRRRIGRFSFVLVALVLGIGAAAPASALAATTTQITAGAYHSCALRSVGTIRCWGLNGGGQLGDGTTTNRRVPVSVSGITTATQITAGGYHSCALLSGGTVKCWGSNSRGELGDGTNTDRTEPVSVSGITTATQITAGFDHSCAVLSDGTIKCWGDNYYGDLGDGTTTNSNLPVSVQGITTATQVSGGGAHTCALLSGGTIKCWGIDGYGSLGDGTFVDSSVPVSVQGITTATQVMAAYNHSCAVLTGGTVKCWGSNDSDQLGDGTKINSNVPVSVQDITTATEVTGGYYHSCAVLSSGTVKCWGWNELVRGGLGDGSDTYGSVSVPVTVTGITTATQITSGGPHLCALLAAGRVGRVKCWGYNGTGQLGDGTTTNSNVPVGVPALVIKPSPPTLTRSPSANFTGKAVEIASTGAEGAPFTCTVDDNAPILCTSPLQLTNLTEGQHTVSVTQMVEGTEFDDNTSEPTTTTWTVDTIAPAAPSIIYGPLRLSTDAHPSFGFTGEEAASFACAIGGARFTQCSSEDAFDGLSDGTHSFRVRQTDQAGNVSPASSPFSWTVDRTPPVAPILAGTPPALTNLRTAKIKFTAATDKSFRCSLDDETPMSCSGSKTMTGLTEGQHTLVVSHSDLAGNTSSTTARWFVDVTIPTLSVSPSVGKIQMGTQSRYYLSVDADATEIEKVEYATASKAPAAKAKNVARMTVNYASPVTFRTSSTIKWLRIQDGAGNWSRWYFAE